MNATTPACLALALAATLAAGCAATDDKAPGEARPSREYRTGSNIPMKDPQPAVTPEERERALEEIRRIQSTGSSGKPKS